MAEPVWPTLSYLDTGEIEDENGNTLFSMPTSTPSAELGERVCSSFNCFADVLALLRGILIYGVEQSTDRLLLRFADQDICSVRANSPEGVALLKLEAARRETLKRAEA